MKQFVNPKYDPLQEIYRTYFRMHPINDADIVYKQLEDKLTFFQKVSLFFKSPIQFYNRRSHYAQCLEIIRVLTYIIKERLYERRYCCAPKERLTEILQEYKKNKCVTLFNYPIDILFGYLKLLIQEHPCHLLTKKARKYIKNPVLDLVHIPAITKQILLTCDPYHRYIIQLLFRIMSYTDQYFYKNNLTTLGILNIFVPMLMGDKSMNKCRKNNHTLYIHIFQRWKEILQYLPKGTVS
ncbi:hypothetical protein NEOKW01_0350 [Nematocida sp. AWRm80]|nr:hypothetical protein NEOKW01_0350 [Nematocida sp. AWRm80]